VSTRVLRRFPDAIAIARVENRTFDTYAAIGALTTWSELSACQVLLPEVSARIPTQQHLP
jgi:hypothetical protein